jgi:hypothetical protein
MNRLDRIIRLRNELEALEKEYERRPWDEELRFRVWNVKGRILDEEMRM